MGFVIVSRTSSDTTQKTTTPSRSSEYPTSESTVDSAQTAGLPDIPTTHNCDACPMPSTSQISVLGDRHSPGLVCLELPVYRSFWVWRRKVHQKRLAPKLLTSSKHGSAHKSIRLAGGAHEAQSQHTLATATAGVVRNSSTVFRGPHG